MRVLAVDWSGSRRGAERRIWIAEATEPGRLARLECGRRADEVSPILLGGGSPTVIGLDFGFAFPAWFMRELECESAHALWRMAAACGEDWLRRCQAPFWGRPGRPRPELPGPHLRETERSVPRTRGIAPKSLFQVGGAGSVGTGSIRGMPLLLRLHAAGASVWPFDAPGWPRVVEIYPRLLTGAVTKSDPAARRAFLEARYRDLQPGHRAAAAASEDAFDAVVSALVMLDHWADLNALPDEMDPVLRVEGRIWHPGWRALT